MYRNSLILLIALLAMAFGTQAQQLAVKSFPTARKFHTVSRWCCKMPDKLYDVRRDFARHDSFYFGSCFGFTFAIGHALCNRCGTPVDFPDVIIIPADKLNAL